VCVEMDESEQNDYWTDNGLYYAKRFVFYAPCILRIPDNSDAKTFTDEFFNNIPEDSDEEECFIETIDNSSDDLTLEVGMTFFTWKSAYDYIKRWSLQQGFFIRQGRCVKVENERRKQTIAFTKPMLDDIEWMCIYGHLKPLSIKRMLKAKYNRKIYNQDLYKVIYKHRKNNPQL
ncbi:19719_t:CDS:2, partial [Rhizophagus irregularis]